MGRVHGQESGEIMIVVATDAEFLEARKRWRDEAIVCTGVGGLNVVRKLQWFNRNAPIINFGYVGSNTLPIGTEVEVGSCHLYHPNVDYDEPIYSLGGTVPCFTSNDFVLSTNIAEPVVFDMELAYILAMGFESVRSIKIVSDNLNLNQYNEKAEVER